MVLEIGLRPGGSALAVGRRGAYRGAALPGVTEPGTSTTPQCGQLAHSATSTDVGWKSRLAKKGIY